MEEKRFDGIARALAGSGTRRRALTGLAAGLAGGALARFGGAGAAPNRGNSACAKFCADTFGADTPKAGECTSAAAKGRGLCFARSKGCAGADPCGEVGGARRCGEDGECTCYSTTEGVGLCLARIGSFEFPGAGCATREQRPPCDTSAECGRGAVCAPLNALGDRDGVCCPNRGENGGKIGFCVDFTIPGALCGTTA